jgi:glycosyltransferase involved in cell wall biosynthesis
MQHFIVGWLKVRAKVFRGNMNLIQVVPSIEEEASGPSYSVVALNRAINRAGVSSRLIATGRETADTNSGIRTFTRSGFPFRLGRSPDMYRWLRREVGAGRVDVIHNNSIWMMPNVYPGWVTRGKNVPLVVSPRGTFSGWAMARSRAIKILFWSSLQKSAISHAKLFHATAENEYSDIRRLGFRQPVAVIPNGIDIPEVSRPAHRGNDRILLFLGRLHPVKGVDLLLEAWARLQGSHPRWRLRIVGPGDADYLRKLKEQADALGLERVTFAGPLYGEEKGEAYRSADLFVLPTHSENFGVAVAEALAAGVPVVTTKGAPWSGLVEHRAGWWVDIDAEYLRRALDEAMSKDPHALAEMGERGRGWMERDFSWDRIAAQMIESYRWIREGGTRPAWIQND